MRAPLRYALILAPVALIGIALAVFQPVGPGATPSSKAKVYHVPTATHCGESSAAAVRAYVADNPGWSPVTVDDLATTDRELWREHYGQAQCPGVVAVDLDGEGAASYALALIEKRNGALREKLVLIEPSASRSSARTLWGPHDVPFPYVVWRTDEREASDFYTGEKTHIEHGAFVFERMEAWAVVYYRRGENMHTVLVSD